MFVVLSNILFLNQNNIPMKKLIKCFLALFAFTLIFYGCEDDITTSEFVLDLSKTGTVEVHLFAQLNQQEMGLNTIPDGTKVSFSIDYSAFNPNATVGQWSQVAETNNGVVIIDSIPTVTAGIQVTVTPEEFLYDQVQPYESPTETELKLFFADPQSLNVYPDQKTFEKIEYNYTSFEDPAEVVDRKWKGRALFNEIEGDLSNIPSGTELTLFNQNWATTVTSEANGIFMSDVPYGEAFTIQFKEMVTIIDNEGNPATRLHRFKADAGPYWETSPVAESIIFTSEIWE